MATPSKPRACDTDGGPRFAPTAQQRRDDFWRPFLAPDTIYENDDPADGHEHDFHLVSPATLGSFGPTGTACLKCGWFKSWGEA